MKQFLLTGALFLCSILSTFAQFSGSGSGTESDPYLIFYADQLTQVRNNLGKDGVYFKLMADIDLGDWLNDNSPSEGWQPIGVEGARFKGIFDGDGHTISNISIKRASTDNVGFFGYTDGATIKNLTIKGDITGQNSVGGVVGAGLNTTITGVHYVGKVTGAENVGGLIGWLTSSSNLKDCSLQGDVKGTKDVGGIVGGTDDLRNTHSNLQCNGTVTATGDNCGGIFGSLAGIDIELKECTTNATIQGHDYVGGIIGYAESLPFKSIEKCNSIITLLGNNYVGGNKALSPIGVYVPSENKTATFHIDGLSEQEAKEVPVIRAPYDTDVYCVTCNKTQHVKAGEPIPFCCGRLMEILD